MMQAVSALGWAVSIFWIMLLLFTVTVVYSAFQIRPVFGKPFLSASSGALTASLPLTLHTGGFYDISEFSITTMINNNRGLSVSASSTHFPVIPHGVNTSIIHEMSINLTHLVTNDLSDLLFFDSELNVTGILKLTYANVFLFEIGANFTLPWGAPLANLTLQSISITPFNSTHVTALVPLSFENHSYIEISGTTRLEIVDNRGRVVGRSIIALEAMPESRFETNMSILLSGNPALVREARLYFVTPLFSYGPVGIPLV